MPTSDVAAMCGISTREAIKRTGVITRHWIHEDDDPLTYGLLAARRAIEAAQLEPKDIDVVLNTSGTQLQAIPDGGAIIAAGLKLKEVSSYSLHATCLSFLFGLQEAAFLISTGRAKNVLIVSTEGGSRGLDFRQPESALLMGDAAAAAVIGPAVDDGQGIVASSFKTQTSGVKDAEIRGGGTRIRSEQTSERLQDFKFDMRGLRLLAGALRNFPPFLESIQPGLSKDAPDIDRIIPHQTSKAGLDGMARLWGRERLEVTLPEVGNTIGAAIPLTLHRAKIKPGERVLLVGTGAGTHYGAIILQC
ncbi:3-oxoacyl-ACP synthase III family protein [Microbacterium sp.]|uniref:3-oxoacyl-ACP synthase III family protein n=1 Tax=Microbacterium sp. TaxID=51671 RepID=UPI003C70B4F2